MKYAISLVLFLSLSGCTVGPQMLRTSRAAYNEAIQQTTLEQLLLNIVRLNYHEPPFFLNVGGVNAQFSVSHTATAVATINENVGEHPLNANTLAITGESSFSDTPTITLTPLQDKEYLRLLEPIDRDTLAYLLGSGRKLDLIFRLCVASIGDIVNQVDPQQRAPGSPPEMPVYLIEQTALGSEQNTKQKPVPGEEEDAQEDCAKKEFKTKFREVVSRLAELKNKRAISIGVTEGGKELAPKFERTDITPELVIDAYEQGLCFQEIKIQKGWYNLTKPTKKLKLAVGNRKNQDWVLVKDLLNLDDHSTYSININKPTSPEESQSNKGKEINISTKSLVAMMMYVSRTIEIPKKHDHLFAVDFVDKAKAALEEFLDNVTKALNAEKKAWDAMKKAEALDSAKAKEKAKTAKEEAETAKEEAETAREEANETLLNIRSSAWRPTHRLAVRYRNYWYYIEDKDESSRMTLSLLEELFLLRAGPVQSPMLTLPL